MGKKRGSITVEAAIVLPFYILLLTFLANFLNIYYVHQVSSMASTAPAPPWLNTVTPST